MEVATAAEQILSQQFALRAPAQVRVSPGLMPRTSLFGFRVKVEIDLGANPNRQTPPPRPPSPTHPHADRARPHPTPLIRQGGALPNRRSLSKNPPLPPPSTPSGPPSPSPQARDRTPSRERAMERGLEPVLNSSKEGGVVHPAPPHRDTGAPAEGPPGRPQSIPLILRISRAGSRGLSTDPPPPLPPPSPPLRSPLSIAPGARPHAVQRTRDGEGARG